MGETAARELKKRPDVNAIGSDGDRLRGRSDGPEISHLYLRPPASRGQKRRRIRYSSLPCGSSARARICCETQPTPIRRDSWNHITFEQLVGDRRGDAV